MKYTPSQIKQKTVSTVAEFRIELSAIPSIWREIQINATASFWDLHTAIEDCFGWLDNGFHEFVIQNPKTREFTRMVLLKEGNNDIPTVLSRNTKIADYFNDTNNLATYRYPLGAEWEVKVTFKKIVEGQTGLSTPRCIAGARLGPPESAWNSKKEHQAWPIILKNPQHPKYQETLKKVNAYCDRTPFNGDKIKFSDPEANFAELYDADGEITDDEIFFDADFD